MTHLGNYFFKHIHWKRQDLSQILYNLISAEQWPMAEQKQLLRQHARHFPAATIIIIIIISQHYHHHHHQWYLCSRGEKQGSMLLQLVSLFVGRLMRMKPKESEDELWEKTWQSDVVMLWRGIIILCCFSLLLLTRRLRLNAWQQAAEETCGGKSWDDVGVSELKNEKKQRGGFWKGRREEEVILSATAIQMTGPSGEISVKRARELCSCFLSSEISQVACCCSLLQGFMDVWSCDSQWGGTCNN